MPLSVRLKDISHHAYYLIGGDQSRAELTAFLEKKHKVKLHGNPDLFDRAYESFTIDDAREVKSTAGTKPVDAAGRKIFVLTMNGITVEAQNALLKLLEEPPEYARFFLIIPSAHLLLPTVKSRLSFIEGDSSAEDALGKGKGAADDEIRKEAVSFLAMPLAKRLDFVKKLMDDIAKDDSPNRPGGKRPKQDVLDLLNALEGTIRAKGLKGNIEKLASIELARKYMNDRSPSLKMLLEYVAMNV